MTCIQHPDLPALKYNRHTVWVWTSDQRHIIPPTFTDYCRNFMAWNNSLCDKQSSNYKMIVSASVSLDTNTFARIYWVFNMLNPLKLLCRLLKAATEVPGFAQVRIYEQKNPETVWIHSQQYLSGELGGENERLYQTECSRLLLQKQKC